MLMAKLIKGYYKDGVWHEYGGKLYDTIGYNTNGSMTQKAITDTLGSVMEVVSGYSMVVRVHGDASCSNLAPFYFVVDGDAFTMTITYNQPAIALNLSIIMGNTDITQEAYQDGVISIDRVTGNVVITVETASVTDTTMLTKRTTADGLQVLNNKALLKWVRGNSSIWQQLRIDTALTKLGTAYTLSSTTGNETITMESFEFDSSTRYFILSLSTSRVTGHKFYMSMQVYADTDTTQPNARFGTGWATSGSSVTGVDYSTLREKNQWVTLHTITNPTAANNTYFKFVIYNQGSGKGWLTENTKVYIKNYTLVDLTKLFGAGNEPTIAEFEKLFPIGYYAYSSDILLNNLMTNYVSKDGNEETLQNVSLNVPTLTGKLNGEGESVVVFPNGMKSSCNEAVNDTYDEIKQVDGVWKAYKRIGSERATNAISGRNEYEILAQEEVYVLDDQTIPTEITVADQGTEEILPTNGATPTTAPVIMEIQYGAIPPNNLLGGGLLGGAKGGGLDEPDYSDGEEITDYEDEQENAEEPIAEEPLEEPKEDENEEEPKEDIKESPVIDEKKELKK